MPTEMVLGELEFQGSQSVRFGESLPLVLSLCCTLLTNEPVQN